MLPDKVWQKLTNFQSFEWPEKLAVLFVWSLRSFLDIFSDIMICSKRALKDKTKTNLVCYRVCLASSQKYQNTSRQRESCYQH